eukprot:gnl/TRDRNA2_/TRDRNA2_61299_c0_seq1.p1 gnl/TRDRNA2_/TRDRNA2_61299_c0~~gnl/TRDRNA2_/TRDRNA2_61299_c0_seq1.p1  ORF type:complete len:172 (+),score=31.85 gnl/TRDRNA2_/TRDRNA2_61299_c0_seq1:63-518(+)
MDAPESSMLGSEAPTLQTSAASFKLEPVDLYCPLPPDLRGALEVLTAKDTTSHNQLGAWLSGDATRLLSFHQYADESSAMALGTAGTEDGREAKTYFETSLERASPSQAKTQRKPSKRAVAATLQEGYDFNAATGQATICAVHKKKKQVSK